VAIGFGPNEWVHSKKNSCDDSTIGDEQKGRQQSDFGVKPFQIDAPRLIAEFAREFGWGLNEILKTPATTFFSLLKSARQIKREEMALQLKEFCDIAAISWGGEKYYSALKNSYSEMLLSPEQLAARKNPRVFDCENPERAKDAAQMFASFLGQAKKMSRTNGR
jgi:hypothetical protein